jgi:membrane protein
VAKNALSKFRAFQERAHAFFLEKDICREDDANRSRLHRFCHFWLLVGKSFIRNRCPVRASALAYTTLLALIPLLAVGVGITTSLLQKEGEAPVRDLLSKLVKNVAPSVGLEAKGGEEEVDRRQQEVVKKITDFIANIQSGTLGITGTIALIFVGIGLLRTIEATFNDIWGVTNCRGWVASIVQYWFAISLGPVLVVLAIALTTGPHFAKTAAVLDKWPMVGALLFGLLPYVVLSLAFALLYQLMPNTRVRWQAAAVGGVVGGVLWQLNNKMSVLYASKAVSYSQIYGSLSIIPLFLAGMYLSWLILLFGAQVSYAFQNRQAYIQEKQAESVNQRGREFIALRLMAEIGRRFLAGEPPGGQNQLASALAIPTRLAGHILSAMVHAGLLIEVADEDSSFTPARPLNTITAHDVLHALRVGRGLELATSDDSTRPVVRAKFEGIAEAEQDAARSVNLEDLARQISALRLATPVPERTAS